MRATLVCLQQYAASNVQRSSAPPKRIGNVNFDVAPASCLLPCLALPRQNHKKIRKTRVVSRKVLIETPLELTLAVPNPSPTPVSPPPRSSPLLLSAALLCEDIIKRKCAVRHVWRVFSVCASSFAAAACKFFCVFPCTFDLPGGCSAQAQLQQRTYS